jgi:hypothetical protein
MPSYSTINPRAPLCSSVSMWLSTSSMRASVQVMREGGRGEGRKGRRTVRWVHAYQKRSVTARVSSPFSPFSLPHKEQTIVPRYGTKLASSLSVISAGYVGARGAEKKEKRGEMRKEERSHEGITHALLSHVSHSSSHSIPYISPTHLSSPFALLSQVQFW